MTVTQDAKAQQFRALHEAPDAFVIANVWDGGSARMMAGLGFAALATSSGASAGLLGRRDGRVTRNEALGQARVICDASDLPVSADLEKGFGDAPEIVAETIRLAAEAGLVGCSIEDASGNPDAPIYDLGQATERIAAAAAAARALPFPFTLTGRTENFLRGRLDLDDTIRSTAANAGWLDIKMVPERHNKVKVLLLMDVGGTMDEHIHRVEEIFSAAKAEFKHLEFYYFHNCVYDFMWKNNRRRYSEKFPTWDIIRKYNKDYKLIFVGDATMSPYEILQPGGSVEYNNEEAGAEWLQRLTHAFPKFAWINPEPQGVWGYRQSISVIQQLMNQRMFPLTLPGLEGAMRLLVK